jgi:5'-3' exonuclease
MGVPFFFRYIQTRHKLVISDVARRSCDVLMLDFNSIIHECARNVKECTSDDAVIENILKWLQVTLPKLCTAKDEIFIAIDGVPPRAKMVQQRQRRYLSSMERSESSQVDSSQFKSSQVLWSWDSTCVTPGTLFMDALTRSLEEYVKSNNCKIVLSTAAVSGEGEHKMFERIRSKKYSDKEVCIYGADADLIFLSLISPCVKISVLRPSQHDDNVHAIDVALLRARLPISPKEFVILCTLLGNDFLPPLSYLRVRENGVDLLLQKYNEVKVRYEGIKVRYEGIKEQRYEGIKEQRYEGIKEQRNEEVELQQYEDDKFALMDSKGQISFRSLTALLDYIATDEAQRLRSLDVNNIIRTDSPGWRSRYARTLCMSVPMKVLCDLYISGISWIVDYYFCYGASKTSDWHYPHLYSPTALDLANHLMDIGQEGLDELKKMTLLKGHVTTSVIRDPRLQLLLVLPPASLYLVDEKLRPIMTDLNLSCLHFYPTTWQIANYMRLPATPLLPLLDATKIVSVAKRLRRRI